VAFEPPVAVGDLVAQKYRVEKRVGAGAMGVVYAAVHEELDEHVALKFLSPLLVGDEQARARFQREAKNAFSLKGQHVARVFDVGRLESGAPFIVMEFLKGDTLREFVARHGRPSIEQSIAIMLQACEGVAEAHGRGIVHRDLKPENIFLTRLASGSPIVKVLDFGISKASSGTNAAITQRDQIVGTLRYMSPEQLAKVKEPGAESDVWALGFITYWLLSGEFPFAGETASIAVAQMLAGAPPVPLREREPAIDAALEAVVMKCVERSKEDRFANADALKRALAPFSRGSLTIPSTDAKIEAAPETHRSELGPQDAPTLERANPSLVKDAIADAETIADAKPRADEDEEDAAIEPDTIDPDTLPLERARIARAKVTTARLGELRPPQIDAKAEATRQPPTKTLPLGTNAQDLLPKRAPAHAPSEPPASPRPPSSAPPAKSTGTMRIAMVVVALVATAAIAWAMMHR
jgi:serine/threonine-protein kinase